jgi:EmrB/QacA subfamily drug resistance transporter
LTSSPSPAGLSDREKRLALVATILGSAVVTVDATVVNVALPAIERELGGGLAGQQWTANAYTLALGSLLLIGGALGDLLGERRVYAFGVTGFGVTSILCAIAPSIELLVVARALQGVAGALLTPAALAVIVATFSAEERGRAVGTWLAWSGIGTVLGPLVGGQIVDVASWRWVFAINVPLVLLTLLLVARFVPASPRDSDRAQLDWRGALLAAFGLAGPTFALIEQPLLGWASPAVFVPGLAGVGLLVAFVLYERRAPEPMLPLSLFGRRNFAVGNLETFSMYAGLSMLFFFLVLFLQQVAGYSALEAGMASVPVTIVMFLLSSRFGALADRVGPRLLLGGGPLVAAAGFALLIGLDGDVDYLSDLLPALLLFALGLSITVAPLTSTVLADADERNAGIASGVNNAIARVAGLIAVAAIGVIVAGRFSASLDESLGSRALSAPARAALAEAERQPLAPVDLSGVSATERAVVARAVETASVVSFRFAMGTGAVLVALGGVLGAIGIRDPRRGRAVRARECSGGQLVGQPQDAARPRSP